MILLFIFLAEGLFVNGGTIMEQKADSFWFHYNGKDIENITEPDIIASQYKNKLIEIYAEGSEEVGLRNPQIGALSAIKSHLSIKQTPATVVLPTGTGKTEVMFSAILNKGYSSVLIIVPSSLLRRQTYERIKKWGILEKIGCLHKDTVKPNVLAILSNKNSDFTIEQIKKSNIVITTLKILSKTDSEVAKYLESWTKVLFIDEAHHISAKTWNAVRQKYRDKIILQFTATPYRQDRKIVDGEIIYNYPMQKAILEGYFKPIKFFPIEEYNLSTDNVLDSDLAISRKAISLLEKDLNQGFDHILLVRANSIQRAEFLYETIYKKYKKLNPVLITSKKKIGKGELNDLRNLKSNIVVCVDMFGEGIDLPNLKIAALHDKFKSLPITLQFIGRFIRSDKKLGDAKVVANIADKIMSKELEDLYRLDADWMYLLPKKSEDNIQLQRDISEIINDFHRISPNEIDLGLFRPKISMRMFKVKLNTKWEPQNWQHIFDISKTSVYIDDKHSTLVLIYPTETIQTWSRQQSLKGLVWEYVVVYWDSENGIICLNSTDDSVGVELLKHVFPDEINLIQGEQVFRCLAGINRIKLANLGLGIRTQGPISYKMFAGINIEEGISSSTRIGASKSNLFGIGYEGDGPISIGCSYKGRIWAKMVENIAFWREWCQKNIKKILDSNNDTTALSGVLVPKIIESLPNDFCPYRMDFDLGLLFSNHIIKIVTTQNIFDISECELQIDCVENNEIKFKLVCEEQVFRYSLNFEDSKYRYIYKEKSSVEPKIIIGKKSSVACSKYWAENNPIVWAVGGRTLEGNLLYECKKIVAGVIPSEFFITKDWAAANVNIKVESQLHQRKRKRKDSIQYYIIEELKQRAENYDIIFDDDDAGEIADIIAIKVDEIQKNIRIELYHCKFSHGPKPGARVSDLYEVCGQTEKSVFWKAKGERLFEQLIYRDKLRLSRNSRSRFEKGDAQELNKIKNMLANYKLDMSIFIVQPGVSLKLITEEMLSILASTRDYALETYNIPTKLICSE